MRHDAITTAVGNMQAGGPRDDRSLAEILAGLSDAEVVALAQELGAEAVQALSVHWLLTARPSQLPPASNWRLWLIMAGRGFGKTRAGAEWIDAMARSMPGIRIAMVGASYHDVREVMVEGESGLLGLPGQDARRGPRPVYYPALRRLVWPGGSMAMAYSAAEPEGLRGPQHHIAWADEIGRWGAAIGDGGARGMAAWDNLLMGMRLGDRPRVVATTTPRAGALMRRVLSSPGIVVSGGPSHANAAHLPPAFLDAMASTYGQSALGRQEIWGELISDIPGALWTRSMIEQARCAAIVPDDQDMDRIVIGVDPPASRSGDACGIIVAGRNGDGKIAILADHSIAGASPARWAAAVADAAAHWQADRIVAEANNGGEMVRAVLHQVAADLPVMLVHARRSKGARAEPVALLYDQGRIRHAGMFAELEDQLCGMTVSRGYVGPGPSPDRADALVWAVHALTSGAADPAIRQMAV